MRRAGETGPRAAPPGPAIATARAEIAAPAPVPRWPAAPPATPCRRTRSGSGRDARSQHRLRRNHVVRPLDDPAQYGQSAAAGTRVAELSQIASVVTYERHRKIVQRRDDDASQRAGCAGFALPVEHLHEHGFRLDMVVLVLRAL